MSEELMLCPFCAGAGLMVCHVVRGIATRATKAYRVECQGECHGMTCYWHTADEAKTAWNTRPDKPYKWATFNEWFPKTISPFNYVPRWVRDFIEVGFNSARERKE